MSESTTTRNPLVVAVEELEAQGVGRGVAAKQVAEKFGKATGTVYGALRREANAGTGTGTTKLPAAVLQAALDKTATPPAAPVDTIEAAKQLIQTRLDELEVERTRLTAALKSLG